ncbi:GNAT family N-acetyltransferase [Gordonia iterans]
MPSAGSVPAARRGGPLRSPRPPLLHRGETSLIMVAALLFTAAALTWSYRVKAACGGAPYDEFGRSARFPVGDPNAVIPCYSDLMFLWVGRDIDNHVFPYIHGGITEQGHLYGGVVEYPVLSGLLMWLGAIGQHTDLEFFRQSALILTPFALAITLLLAWMSRWWVLLWAATPPLVLYAFHNWETPVVFTSVAAIAVMAWAASANPRTGERRMSLRTSSIIASVLLAVGFSLKLYPGLFVLPLALYVLTCGEQGDRLRDGARRAYDWAGAAWVVAAAVVTTLIVQLPFMVAGYQGWKAALDFQGKRKADIDTNTFWYWGNYWIGNDDTDLYNSIVGLASPVLIIAGLAAAIYLAWRRYTETGVFPWIGASFAMLAAFMLFHKVHSPQYTLWVLPFFVLMRVRWWAIAIYLVTDVILDLTIFRLFGVINSGSDMVWWVIGGVNLGVWAHWVLLAYFLVTACRTGLREPLASFVRSELPPDPPLTRLAAADARDARCWLGTPVLERAGITLRPLTVTNARNLAAVAADDPDLGRWTSGTPGDLGSAVEFITAAHRTPTRLAFAVIDDRSGDLVGTTSFYDVDEANRTLAIGYTYYARAAHGTVVNPAAKLMLLDYAFSEAGAVRVVWHTHEQNAQSRAAIAKLGATFEGLLRKHRRFQGGWRTTAQYAMTDDDWSHARERLAERVDHLDSAPV